MFAPGEFDNMIPRPATATSALAGAAELREMLLQPEIISCLLAGRLEQIPGIGRTSIVEWELQQQFYAQHGRALYRVECADGAGLALKINCEPQRIRREVMLLDWLGTVQPATFAVSEVVAWEDNIQVTEDTVCAWFIQPWIAGETISHDRAADMAPAIGPAMAELHNLGAGWAAIAGRYGLEPPSGREVIADCRARHISAIEQTIAIADKALSKPLAAVRAAFTAQNKNYPLCLLNGDSHLNNFLLKSDETRGRTRLWWLDWEDSTVDHPLSEVAHYLAYSELFHSLDVRRPLVTAYFEHPPQWCAKEERDSIAPSLRVWRGVWMAHFLRHGLRMALTSQERAAINGRLQCALDQWLQEGDIAANEEANR